jgi:hypothetical protein
LVNAEHLAFKGVMRSRHVASPPSFFLLCVDEALRLARWPAIFVKLQAFDEPFDDPMLIVRIENLKCVGQFGVAGMATQQAVGQPVKSAYPKIAGGNTKERLYASSHFTGGLIGEGDRQDALWGDRFGLDQPSDSVNEDAGFSAPGTREH